MKTKILLLLLLTMVSVGVCGQSLSGRFVTDDEDSFVEYFVFTRNTVRIRMDIFGIMRTVSGTFEIEYGEYVVISTSEGIIELEIEDNNTLIGIGFPVDDVVFTRRR